MDAPRQVSVVEPDGQCPAETPSVARPTLPRVLGLTLRVADLNRSTAFYRDRLGMTILGQGPEVRRLGYGRERGGLLIDLIHDERGAIHGTGFGHVAVSVVDVPATFARLVEGSTPFTQEPMVLATGGPCCAFIKDPDGYAVELVAKQRSPLPEGAARATFDARRIILGPDDSQPRLMHVMLRITDVEATLRFYVDALDMTLFERIDLPMRGGVTTMFLGYDADEPGRQLELTCAHQPHVPYTHGTGFGPVAIGVPDLFAALARLRTHDVRFDRSEGSARATLHDPDRYPIALIAAPAGQDQ